MPRRKPLKNILRLVQSKRSCSGEISFFEVLNCPSPSLISKGSSNPSSQQIRACSKNTLSLFKRLLQAIFVETVFFTTLCSAPESAALSADVSAAKPFAPSSASVVVFLSLLDVESVVYASSLASFELASFELASFEATSEAYIAIGQLFLEGTPIHAECIPRLNLGSSDSTDHTCLPSSLSLVKSAIR